MKPSFVSIGHSIRLPSVLIGTILALLLIKHTSAMATTNQDEDKQETGESVSQSKMIGPLYEFAGKLMGELNKQNAKHDNVIISPVSIHQALSMVLLGSDANSETKQEIQNSIGYANMSESDIEQCHEQYAKIMTAFKLITEHTLRERKSFEEANKAQENQSQWELARAQSSKPVLDLFTMLVTKNQGQIKPDYERDITKYFHASIGNIDDKKPETKEALLSKMNNWAKEAGFEGPIMDRKYLDDDFAALLLSAIRVEAFWSENFEEWEADKVFYNYGAKDKPVKGKCLSVSDMRGSRLLEFTTRELAQTKSLHEHMSNDATFKRLSGLNFRAVELPLLHDLSFAIFEPIVTGNTTSGPTSSGTTIGQLNKLIDDLFAKHDSNQTNLANALELLDQPGNRNKLDDFRMPKFKFESDIDLKSALKSIGLRRAFDRRAAEISNMMDNKLAISDIKHKAVIEATKTGIKAAGITMVKMVFLSALNKSPTINVVIENPFMFVLRYNKIPLFVGQLTHL